MNNPFLILDDIASDEQEAIIRTGMLLAPVYPPEDQLYLEVTEVNKNEVERLIEDSNSCLQIAGLQIPLLATEIKISAINDFQVVAAAISASPNPCANWLTGMRVFYAIKSGVFTLYYRPVKFCLSFSSYGQGAQLFGHYNGIEDVNSFYEYDGTDFVEVTSPVDLTRIGDEIKAYQHPVNGVKIRHRSSEILLNPFVDATDITGDIKSIVFPFQEFSALNLANPGNTSIKLWNSVEAVPYMDDTWNKHALLLSSEQVTSIDPSILLRAYIGAFADLSHLCPPSCGSIYTFRLRA